MSNNFIKLDRKLIRVLGLNKAVSSDNFDTTNKDLKEKGW